MASVAVVGAGVFGAWTALRVAEAGHRVTLLDAFGPANGRASSADHSRVIRAGYGSAAVYSRWATQSARDWQWLATETNQELYTTTGALFLGAPNDPYLTATHETLSGLGLDVEWLESSAIAARFQVIAIDGLGPAIFEPAAGVLRARAAVQALVALACSRARVQYMRGWVRSFDENRSTAAITMADGAALHADVYVIACGPWLPQIFPQAVGERIRRTRQEVLYFGVPPGDARYSAAQLPVWIDFVAGVYGIGDLDGYGFKVGIDRHGPPIDPDATDRVVSPEIVETTRRWLALRFPGLTRAPLVDSRVCQYENTSSGDFIIDRHPAWANVWIVGGGSGHGFKHGPAVGRYVTDLIEGRIKPESRFALSVKTTDARRMIF